MPAKPAPSRPVEPAKPAQGRSAAPAKAAPVKPAAPGRAAPGKAAPAERAPSRSAARPSTRPSAARTARPRQGRPPRAPFVLLVVGLLCGGLVSLLLLNVVLAQDSYRLNELRNGISKLQLQKADRENENARLNMPGEVAKRAELQGQDRDWDSMNTIDSRVASQGQAPVTRERVEGTGR
ncbi:hypothetical protein [Streptosporangium sandarakinum]|uniref:hypothetical protein n=1 Tax=Streptosporangium sandarakinum TaxID=1260955 RepID=UPI003436027B